MKEYFYSEQTLDNRKFVFVKIDADIFNDSPKGKEIFDALGKHFIDAEIILILPNNINRAYQVVADPEISNELFLRIMEIYFEWKTIVL